MRKKDQPEIITEKNKDGEKKVLPKLTEWVKKTFNKEESPPKVKGLKTFFSYLYFYLKAPFRKLKPPQILVIGFLTYVVIGTILLTLSFSQKTPVEFLDNLFNITSAMSTTGLTTVSVSDSYTFWGQLVLVILFQLGGIGYMTISSFIILATGKQLSETRKGILSAEFTLPKGFEITSFIRQVVLFTLVIETIGSIILWIEFSVAGVENPLWSAIFHCISAFATAGFSLNNNSLESFSGNYVVNITIAVLCYAGALGFIVLQDFWRFIRNRPKYKMTLTSKIIIFMTLVVLFGGIPLLFFFEPSIGNLPVPERLLASFFQVMTASSTAGFNTINIGNMSIAALFVIIIAMIIGASPSGTGGGIKTTTISALYAILSSILKGKSKISFWKRDVPLLRLFTAVSSATLYIAILGIGIYLLSLTQHFSFMEIFFEASSALGTVGLSLGITGELNSFGKIIIIILMFIGRVGPLTFGLSFFHGRIENNYQEKDDIAV